MKLAYDRWYRNQLSESSRFLVRQIPEPGEMDLRGLEWHVLNSEVKLALHTLGSHTGAATECVLFPDGSTAASAGEGGLVHMWDLDSRSKLKSFAPDIGPIHALAVSPDGMTLAVGGKPLSETFDRARVYLLDSNTGEPKGALQQHATTIESISFSPDGDYIAAGSRYSELKLSTVGGEVLHTFPAKTRNETIEFSPDGRFLAALGDRSKVHVWECASGKAHDVIPSNLSIGQIRWAPNGTQIVFVGHQRPAAELFDPESGQHLAILRIPEPTPRRLSAIAFTPGGETIVAGDVEGSVYQWQVRDAAWRESLAAGGRIIQEHKDLHTVHVGRVTGILATGDGRIVTTCDDGSVNLLVTNAAAARVLILNFDVTAAATRNGALYVGSSDGTIRQRNLESGKTTVLAQASRDRVADLTLSADASRLASVDVSGRIHVLDTETGDVIWTPITKTGHSLHYRIALSPDGRSLASSGADDALVLWDVERRVPAFTRRWSSAGRCVAFSPNGRLVAWGHNLIQIFEVETGELLQESVGGEQANSICFSPDGRYLASGHWDGSVRVFDLQSQKVRIMRSHRSAVQCVAFSSDGKSLVSTDNGQSDASIAVWNVETGENFGALPNPLLSTQKAAGDYHVLATESRLIAYDPTVPATRLHVWDLPGSSTKSAPNAFANVSQIQPDAFTATVTPAADREIEGDETMRRAIKTEADNRVVFSHKGNVDPVVEGWARTSGSGTAGPIDNDLGWIDAWFVRDASSAGGSVIHYMQAPTTAQTAAAALSGWTLSTFLRLPDNSDPLDGSPFVCYRDGTRSWQIFFAREEGALIVQLHQAPGGPEFRLDQADRGYHLYELVYDPRTKTADLFVDGVERISDYVGYPSSGWLVGWGVGDSGGIGGAHFNSVEWSICQRADRDEAPVLAAPDSTNE